MQNDFQKRAAGRDGVATPVGLTTTMMGAIIGALAVVVIAIYAFGPWRTDTTLSGVPGTTVGQNTAPVVPSTTPNNSKTTK